MNLELPSPAPPVASARTPLLGKAEAGPRTRVIAFAVVALGLLVGTAVAFSMMRTDGADPPAGSAQADPETYAAKAVQRMDALSTVGAATSTAGTPVGGLPTGVEAGAYASFDAEVASAIQALEAALAASTLPEVPTDYVAGTVPDVRLPASQGYSLPELPSVPVAGTFVGAVVEGEESPVGSRPGSTPLGDLLTQVEDGLATLEGILGGLPVGGPLPVLPALPVGGSAPTQARDAEGAIEPDEEGAALADRHANALLGLTASAYASTSSNLTALLAGYQDLAARLEQTIELTRRIEGDASVGIRATLDQRLAAIDAETRTLNAQAASVVAEHTRLVDTAAGQASTAVRTALDNQVSAVGQTRVEALGEIDAGIQGVLRQAEANKAEVGLLLVAAEADLGAPGASPEALYSLEAVRAASVVAIATIDREAKAQVMALEEARLRIEEESDATVKALAGKAGKVLEQVNGTAATSIEATAEVKSYLLAVAAEQAEQAELREVRLATETLATLEDEADAHVTMLVRTSLKSTESASAILASTSRLVDDVEQLASSEVGKDLEYIAQVSQDYGRVPTEDRKARASHWSTAAADIEGLLDSTLSAGQSIEFLAKRTVDAATQARAEIGAMA